MGTRLPTDLTASLTFHVIFGDVVLQVILLYHFDTFATLHILPAGMMQLHVPVPGLGRSDLSHIGATTVKTERFLNGVLFHMPFVKRIFG